MPARHVTSRHVHIAPQNNTPSHECEEVVFGFGVNGSRWQVGLSGGDEMMHRVSSTTRHAHAINIVQLHVTCNPQPHPALHDHTLPRAPPQSSGRNCNSQPPTLPPYRACSSSSTYLPPHTHTEHADPPPQKNLPHLCSLKVRESRSRCLGLRVPPLTHTLLSVLVKFLHAGTTTPV